jgi:AraC-like DNA-binding protein
MTGVPPAAFRQCLFLNAIPVPAWQEDLKLLSTIARPLTGARALAYSYRLSALLLGLLEYAEGMGTEQILSMADRYVEQASSYLEEHVQTVTHLEEVADAVAISDDYLRHIFRAKTGVSLVNYLMRLRIERAKNLIRHSTLTLSAIANLSGFSNARYFATSFRRAVGCSPSAYRAGAAATVSVPQRNDKPTGE